MAYCNPLEERHEDAYSGSPLSDEPPRLRVASQPPAQTTRREAGAPTTPIGKCRKYNLSGDHPTHSRNRAFDHFACTNRNPAQQRTSAKRAYIPSKPSPITECVSCNLYLKQNPPRELLVHPCMALSSPCEVSPCRRVPAAVPTAVGPRRRARFDEVRRCGRWRAR